MLNLFKRSVDHYERQLNAGTSAEKRKRQPRLWGVWRSHRLFSPCSMPLRTHPPRYAWPLRSHSCYWVTRVVGSPC